LIVGAVIGRPHYKKQTTDGRPMTAPTRLRGDNMEPKLSISQVAKACGGIYWNVAEDAVVQGVTTDSRNVNKGDIFIALSGDNFDGHDFVADTIKAGALCAVVDGDAKRFSNLPIIAVEDCRAALRDIAKLYRQQFDIPVIGITGSVGKTSTKDMIASVFSTAYNTLKTQGNFNNEVGLPLTIFQLTNDHSVVVLEMGMNNFYEISRLSNIAMPDVAVITNIGVSHIENLGSQDNILKAKLEILDGLSNDGAVVLNGDDKRLYALDGTLGYETLYYGIENPNCDIIAKDIKKTGSGSEFSVSFNGEEYKIATSAPGEHHIYNALAAILVGVRYNIPMEKIIEGIANFSPGAMRQNIIKLENYTLIEDCYNASPDSMKAGLEVLTRLAADDQATEKRTVAVLGDMLELGEFSESQHTAVGKMVFDAGIDMLITVGHEAEYIAKGARELGFGGEIYSFKDNVQLKDRVNELIKPGDYILFKGSRGMKLEEISQYIAENGGETVE